MGMLLELLAGFLLIFIFPILTIISAKYAISTDSVFGRIVGLFLAILFALGTYAEWVHPVITLIKNTINF